MLFLLIFLVSCTKNNVVKINGIKINVEIAETEGERQQGLMFRSELEENEGMLFVFEDEQPRSFWMKNTLIPLDIIFFDKNFSVVSYVENMEPCLEDPCPIYDSKESTKYALEVNSGFVRENNIKQGMTAKLWQ